MSATSITQPRSVSGPGRLRGWVEGRRPGLPLIAGTVVLVLAFAGLLATHKPPKLPVPAARAVALVRQDRECHQILQATGANRLVAMSLDSHFDQVFAYRGGQAVLVADVSVHGQVEAPAELLGPSFAFGNAIANQPLVLALLCLTFLLMTAVWPLQRLRNLDALVAVSLVSAVVLFNDERLRDMVLAAYPALGYLALRAAWRALGPGRAAAHSTPLFEHLTVRWSFSAQRRVLRLGAVAAALIVTMVGFSSLHVVDVGIAVMEGATLIIHGVLPYGHIPDVLHGDTYPLGSYLFYTPIALHWPVHDAWGDANPTLVVAAAAAAAAASGLARVVRRVAVRAAAGLGELNSGTAERAELAGLRAAIAWLMFPTLLVTVSTGTTDVVLGALLLGALVLWRRPAWATGALAAGAWFKLAPALLLPLSLARVRGRALARSVLAVTLVSVPMVALLFALGGAAGLTGMLKGLAFQQTRTSPHNLWVVTGSVPYQQLAQALTCALVAGAVVRLRRDGRLARDRARMAALCAAILLGVQISANYWSCMYLAWIVPLLCLGLWTPAEEPDPAVS